MPSSHRLLPLPLLVLAGAGLLFPITLATMEGFPARFSLFVAESSCPCLAEEARALTRRVFRAAGASASVLVLPRTFPLDAACMAAYPGTASRRWQGQVCFSQLALAPCFLRWLAGGISLRLW